MLTVGLGAWSQDCECLQGKVASKYSSGGLGGRGGGRGREKGKPEEEDNAVCYCVALAVLWNRGENIPGLQWSELHSPWGPHSAEVQAEPLVFTQG